MAQAQTLSLTASNYNGTNISCFGAQDGSINLTITGGTPPYTIRWTNDATTEDISNLAAGFYMVEVDDADTTTDMVSADITLTEPEALSVELTVSDYLVNARHYNISLSGACNGSITPTVTGGTAPYTYNWEPYGQTTANLTNICAGGYNLNVTDANGCATPAQQDMTEPDRDDWQMNGNANTSPNSQFIGTTDNKDLIFKTNGVTRLNLKATGDAVFSSLSGTGDRIVFADATGQLKITPIVIPNCATDPPVLAFQQSPVNNADVFTCWRNVGIGTTSPQDKLEVKGMARFGGWNTTSSYIKIGHDGVDAQGQGGNSNIDNFGNGDLNINTYSPKNVNICTGNSGNVTLGGNNYLAPDGGKFVNIGSPSNSNYKLNVGGEINATGLRINGTALSLSSQWQANGNDIYFSGGKVGINTSTPEDKLQVNGGSNKLLAGSAGTSDLDWGTSYIGFNAARTASGWKTTTDNVHNGGAAMWGTINGDVYFSTIPNSANSTIDQTNISDATVKSNTKLIISNNGNIGINEFNPDAKLVVNDGWLKIKKNGKTLRFAAENGSPYCGEIGSSAGQILFWYTGGVGYNKLTCGGLEVISNNSNTLNFKVDENGLAQARSFKVTLSTFADFVFNPDYKLMPLKELEEFLIINKHLPEIPTEKEIVKDGLDVGIMLTKAFQKIEELTLYAIDAKKENEQLKKENAEIKKEVLEIKAKLNRQ